MAPLEALLILVAVLVGLLAGWLIRARMAAPSEAERKARAAKKLRENLQKRKQQVRARRAGDADETIGLPAAKTDESSS